MSYRLPALANLPNQLASDLSQAILRAKGSL
jgi:hypothetical protein